MQRKTQRTYHLIIKGTWGIFLLLSTLVQADAYVESSEDIVIQCQVDCSAVSEKVVALGGTVNISYDNIDALNVTISVSDITALEKYAGVVSLRKVKMIPLPAVNALRTLNHRGLSSNTIIPFDVKTKISNNNFSPKNYIINNINNGTLNLHLQEITGKDVIVAIIDSGTANNDEVVPALAGSVIGGENFIDFPEEPSATSTLNEDHGTMVGSMIAAHMAIVLPNDSPFAQSMQMHAPQSIFEHDVDNSYVPMLGTAPDASLYPLKVFPASGAGTPDSIVIAAMDRALTLKKNYDMGMPSVPVSGDGSEENPFKYDSLNIQVVNMSLGGSTMFPGNSIEDLLVLEMLKHGITVVTAAGNEGFGAMTGSGPGTSTGSINVGAASNPANERILRDLQFDVGVGMIFRPDNKMQMAYFSSRGPTADGRIGIDLVANGIASFVQGADGGISFVAGTSFSSPTVAGAAALLWSAATQENVSAVEIRAALIQSANPDILDHEDYGPIDRGHGFLNAEAAVALLATQKDIDTPKPPEFDGEPSKVLKNIKDLDLNIVTLSKDETFSVDIELNPGEVINFLVPTKLKTAQLTIKMIDIKAELPKEKQNQLFGDAFFFEILDAPTAMNDVLVDARLLDADPDAIFEIPLPQSGIVRVAALGDWTNAGKISATLEISARYRKLASTIFDGSIRDDKVDSFLVDITPETTQLNFELSWKADWGTYPPHDIDLILIDPDGNYIFDAATLDIPERLRIENPMPGQWNIIIAGYMLHGLKDEYALRITDQDGKSIEED